MNDPQVRRDAHAVMLAAFRGPEVPDWLPEAFEAGLGGICLYGDNVHPVEGIGTVARAVSTLDPTAVLALDEEGGDVTRLHVLEGSPSPGNAALGQVDDVDATRAVAAGIGAELRSVGVWLDLAPSADVNSNPSNPVIGTRSFGSDPELVARHVAAYVQGLADQGVAASVKHFPGHGDTSTDSHEALPTVAADAATLADRELVPFLRAIEAGAATIMTSHVVLSALDPERPATLSPAVLTGLLRERLGFDGVIVTDALDMAGASATLGLGGAAVASLAAGADLLCLGPEPTDDPSALQSAVEAVVAAVVDGTLSAERLADAADRVRRLRATWAAPLGAGTPDDALERAINGSRRVARAIVDRAAVGPLEGDVTVVRLDTGTNPAVGDTAWGRLDVPGDRIDLAPDDLPGTPPLDGQVLVVVRRATARPDVWSWIEKQLDANPTARLVELGWPDPGLADRDDVIRLWGSARVLTEALSDSLRGER